MKTPGTRMRGFITAFAAALMWLTAFPLSKAAAQNYYGDDDYYGGGDYQEFYDDLAPYGQWFNDPQYGYVWTPNAGAGFRPYYTNGRWAMTEYGNMWVSDYAWGWAPFHYGRWAQSAMYGWIWIPGNVWGPAWVNWRQGGGYYGWSPMGPGVSINISFGSGYAAPYDWWTFIPCNHIYANSYAPYYAPRRTVNIINNTTIINNTYVDNRSRNTYITGPRRSEIEATTRQRVRVYGVNNRSRSGATSLSGRNVEVYRPRIATAPAGRQLSAPRGVKTLDRSVVTNAGGGRPPARPVGRETPGNNARPGVQPGNRPALNGRDQQMQQQRAERSQQMQQQSRVQNGRQMQQQQRVQRDQQMQQQRAQQEQQRVQRMQQDQQMQQQRIQRDQQMQQQRAQQEQQRVQRMQQDQQMQQQRIQRDQQMQQQRVQQEQQRMQRDQQMQQQRVQQEQQRMQRDQQMQQQRVQQDQQRMQRDRQMQQRSVERPQPQQRNVERSAPAPQRSVERPARGR